MRRFGLKICVKLPTQRAGLLKNLKEPLASAFLRAAIHPHTKQKAFWQVQ